MTLPGGTSPRAPPSTSAPPSPTDAPAPHPGYPAPGYPAYPPPGYVLVPQRARPQHLGVAAGCTAAVGVIALLVGVVLLFAAFFLTGLFAAFVPVPMGWLTGSLGLLSLFPIVYGAVTLGAGVGLGAGRPGSWTTAVVVNVLSLLFALPSLAAAGFGLLHGALSGIALWALFQPEVRAYFGQ